MYPINQIPVLTTWFNSIKFWLYNGSASNYTLNKIQLEEEQQLAQMDLYPD